MGKNKFFSVLGGVAEVGITLGYIVFSMLFLIFGYEDYPLNRNGIVPIGCFFAIAAFHFLAGMALRHVSRYFERHPFLFGEVGCGIGIAGIIVWEMSAWYADAFMVKQAESFMVVVVFLLLLHQRICLCYLFEKYWKSGAISYLLLHVGSVLVLATDKIILPDKGSTMMIWHTVPWRVVPLWLTCTFLLGLSGHLLSAAWRKKSGESGERQNCRRRVYTTVLSRGILLFLFMAVSEETADRMLSPSPRRDEEGYYLLWSREGFEWFVDRVEIDEERDINVRLTADIVLNDTSDWEHWEEEPPKNTYDCVARYRGHFDGNGHMLEGYCSAQDLPVFGTLEKQALVTDLKIRKSLFRTTYEEDLLQDDDGGVFVIPASALCYRNEGKIEGCDVEAIVLGDWRAGGIACVNEGGLMKDCRFAGTVESGRWFEEGEGEERWAVENIDTGGICIASTGSIQNCRNEGAILSGAITDTRPVQYNCGGIVGAVRGGGRVEACENLGRVEGSQICGGIAGISRGDIRECSNMGVVYVKQEMSEMAGDTTPVISAGICASNGGLVDSCFSTGEVSVEQISLSACVPVYGIACNTINPERGRTKNCYYLPESARQNHRQKGVYKLSRTQMAEVGMYIEAGQAARKGTGFIFDTYVISDMDSRELFSVLPDFPGTDRDDYIHLWMGPEQDTVYQVQNGDTLWGIAEKFYGDGMYHSSLMREEKAAGDTIYPGKKIRIPRIDRYLLCAYEEEGYGEEVGDMRILYYPDDNEEGDFLAGDWAGAKEKIRESAEVYCGEGIENLRFYRYGLDGGESLCGYSFRLYPDRCPFESELRGEADGQRYAGTEEALNCAVFYRMREGLLAEFIGIEPVSGDMHVLEQTRYLAARAEDGPAIGELEYMGEDFYGGENWPFISLRNPFAAALEYSSVAECDACVPVKRG